MSFGSNQGDNSDVQTPGQSDQMYNHLLSAYNDDQIEKFMIEPVKEQGRTEILERVNSTISDDNAKLKSFDDVLKLVDNAKNVSVWQGNMKKSAQEQNIALDDNGNVVSINGQNIATVQAAEQSVGATQTESDVKADPYDEYLNDNKKKQFFSTLDPEVAKKVQENSVALGVDPLTYYNAHKEQLTVVKEVAESNNSNEETTLQEEATSNQEATDDELPDPNSGWGVNQ